MAGVDVTPWFGIMPPNPCTATLPVRGRSAWPSPACPAGKLPGYCLNHRLSRWGGNRAGGSAVDCRRDSPTRGGARMRTPSEAGGEKQVAHFFRLSPRIEGERETDVVELLAADDEVRAAVSEEIEEMVERAISLE